VVLLSRKVRVQVLGHRRQTSIARVHLDRGAALERVNSLLAQALCIASCESEAGWSGAMQKPLYAGPDGMGEVPVHVHTSQRGSTAIRPTTRPPLVRRSIQLGPEKA
jgi:hypothetical protein